MNAYLDIGDSGPDVQELQSLLTAMGYDVASDGVFGPGTDMAVRQYQTDRGLDVDGIVGPQTMQTLRSGVHIAMDMEAPPPQGTMHVLMALRIPTDRIATWAQPLDESMEWAAILSVNQRASFLANVIHESGHLAHVQENLNYSASALPKLWPRYFTERTAMQYGRTAQQPANQQMIANIAYGNRMGNGTSSTGDGWKFRGRGPIQLTGKDNYLAFTEDTGIDIYHNPDLALDPATGSRIAGWFWRTRRLNEIADRQDWKEICRRINGGFNGLQERIDMTLAAKAALE